jgi:transposase-like protein
MKKLKEGDKSMELKISVSEAVEYDNMTNIIERLNKEFKRRTKSM